MPIKQGEEGPKGLAKMGTQGEGLVFARSVCPLVGFFCSFSLFLLSFFLLVLARPQGPLASGTGKNCAEQGGRAQEQEQGEEGLAFRAGLVPLVGFLRLFSPFSPSFP
jgi:hypothetical protein